MNATAWLAGAGGRGYLLIVSELPTHNAGPGPEPTPAERRELRSRANRLKARLIVGRKRLTETMLAEVRGELLRDELIKVRLDEDDAGEAETLAEELAAQVPCHLVQRIGRVALLYRRRPAEGTR